MIDCFECVNIYIESANAIYIIDGGYLLHRVVWDRENTFEDILDKYLQYFRRHFGHNVTIIFDGYTDYTKNIKAAEQLRRAKQTSSR